MIGVYSALFGVYDDPPPITYDGVLFTDQDISPEGWDVRRVDAPHEDTRYASRFYFDQSCRVMPDCEYTIMHGANNYLKSEPVKILKHADLPRSIDIAVCKHPRGSVYEETEACIRMGKDDALVINEQMARYRDEGFPESFPLSACIIMVRRNTPRLAEFEAFWWNEVKNGSCRDQLSFDYARWKLGVDVRYLPHHWRSYLKVARHKNNAINRRTGPPDKRTKRAAR